MTNLEKDFAKTLGPGWPQREINDEIRQALTEGYDPLSFSEKLIVHFAPKLERALREGEIEDPFAATLKRSVAFHGHREETPYRKNCHERFGIDPEDFDDLWDLRLQGWPILPAPRSPLKKKPIERQAIAKNTAISEQDLRCDDVVLSARMGIGGNEKVAASLARRSASMGRKSVILVTDTNDILHERYGDCTIRTLEDFWEGDEPPKGVAQRVELLRSALIALSPKRIFVTASAVANWALMNDTVLQDYEVDYSLYCCNRYNGGRYDGFYLDLPWLEPHVSRFLTDNTVMEERLISEGIPADRVRSFHVPVDLSDPIDGQGDIILWASRLDDQKRPELLFEIAEKHPHLNFRVYGAVVLDSIDWGARLSALPNVDYRGEFTDFSKLDMSGCSAFLYTSYFDGLPNIVLEAMAAGFPIVANDVGSLAHVLADGRGIIVPVGGNDEVQCFGDHLEFLVSKERQAAQEIGNKARDYVATLHTPEQFAEDVSEEK